MKKIFILYLIGLFINIKVVADTQSIKVTVIPWTNVNIYQIKSENTNREVIDLGHFNSNFSSGDIKIGTIDVDIIMSKNSNENKLEFDVVDLEKLNEVTLNYIYDVTKFIGSSSGNMELKIVNLQNIYTEPEIIGNKKRVVFKVDADGINSISRLKYSFDLVASLNSLLSGTMNGYSPTTSETTSEKAYINLKDIITAQIRGNTGM